MGAGAQGRLTMADETAWPCEARRAFGYGVGVIAWTCCTMRALGTTSLVSPCHCQRTMPCRSIRTSVRRAAHRPRALHRLRAMARDPLRITQRGWEVIKVR